MIGLDYLLAGYFHLASGQIKCTLKKAPEIHVAASDTSVIYDHTRTQEQMDNFHHDTVNPYGDNVQSHVGGLMAGEVSISQNMRIMQETYPNLNAGCLYIDSVKVEIHIKPKIYIAKQYPTTGCMYKEIMIHEQKHVKVDRMLVNKYTTLIVNGLDTALKKLGYAQGPMTIGQVKPNQEAIQKYAQQVLKVYSDQLSEERRRLQQNVDTLQEYERVQAQCRGKQ